MMKFKYFGIVFLLALVLRLPNFWLPKSIVFDEVAGMTYSLFLLHHKPFFDVHPPMINLIYRTLIKGFHPNFINKISDNDHNFDNFPYHLLRLVTVIIGSTIPVLAMIIGWDLFKNKLTSMAIGLMTAFDNALIIFSRFILPDMWLIFFGLIGLVLALKKDKLLTNIGIGFFMGMTVSVKWTGLGFWVVTLGILLLKKRYKGIITAMTIGLISYIAVWILFFTSLLPGKAFSGIQSYSNKFNYPDKSNLIEIIKYLPKHHLLMFQANKVIQSHEASSPPWLWIFGEKKFSLFTLKDRTIVLMGNLWGWWSALAGVIYVILKRDKSKIMLVLVASYLINILPFLFFPRVFFIYHYFPALIMGYLILSSVVIEIKPKLVKWWLVMLLIVFLVISPVTYGWKVPMWWLKILAN